MFQCVWMLVGVKLPGQPPWWRVCCRFCVKEQLVCIIYWRNVVDFFFFLHGIFVEFFRRRERKSGREASVAHVILQMVFGGAQAVMAHMKSLSMIRPLVGQPVAPPPSAASGRPIVKGGWEGAQSRVAFCWVIDLFYILLPVSGFRIALGVVFALSCPPPPPHKKEEAKKKLWSWWKGGVWYGIHLQRNIQILSDKK